VFRRFAITVFVLWPAFAWAGQVFDGAWFKVTYPDGFAAAGSLKSPSSDGFDSATFRDPGGDVEFYIYSPQVGGKAEDLEQAVADDTLVASAEAKGKDRIVRWRTFSAADNSYSRSVEETRTGDGQYVTRVIAIKYRNAAALAKFKSAYDAFKASYEAFAD
jgi:hypothetical protein